MPSRLRRTAIICVYLLLVYITVSIAVVILVGAGLISQACVNSSR
jgi:hypothetical protein